MRPMDEYSAAASSEVGSEKPVASHTDRSTVRPPDRVEQVWMSGQLYRLCAGNLGSESCALPSAHSYTSRRPVMRATYVTAASVEQIVERLSERDKAILMDLDRLRVLTGDQLTRLHFAELSPGSRERTRRRVLARLVEYHLVATLDRTVGGVRAGSAGHVYSLGIAGQRLLRLLDASLPTDDRVGRTRSPATPGSLFVAHSLAIAALFVELREHERSGEVTLAQFVVEGAAWHPDHRSSVIKPDAYVRVQSNEIEDCWWVEVDRATESIPTLKRKLRAYVEFARAGQLGPDGITPQVLVTVPHDHRLTAVRTMITELPTPAAELIFLTLHDQAARLMIAQLWD